MKVFGFEWFKTMSENKKYWNLNLGTVVKKTKDMSKNTNFIVDCLNNMKPRDFQNKFSVNKFTAFRRLLEGKIP